jgi:hypothetical protein
MREWGMEWCVEMIVSYVHTLRTIASYLIYLRITYKT